MARRFWRLREIIVAIRNSFGIMALSAIAAQPVAALAQQAPTASISEMATTPLVRVNIAESLRTPPDEASSPPPLSNASPVT